MEETKKYTLLIIDDSEMNIVILKRMLTRDYNVISAKTGNKGIEEANAHVPDIIILDVIMPGMDGYETITELKKSEVTGHIPVIFITGLNSAEDEEKGLALGAADYIIKPFSEAVVRLRVHNQIRMLDYIRTIENLMMTDQLTKMPNRRSFDERLQAEWKRAKRKQSPVSILIIDIDYFKKYNDAYGHPQGDVVLQSIAQVFMNTIRDSGDFAARWGGEEFIVLLPETNLTDAMTVAERVRFNVEQMDVVRGAETDKVTVSIGVNTQIPDEKMLIKDFIHYADDALYNAKKEGRNRVCKCGGI